MKWVQEGRELSKETPNYPPSQYPVPTRDDRKIRAFREDVLAHQAAHKPLIDVRSPREYSGELLHMADYPQEGALRGGHIPGAKSVPWARAIRDTRAGRYSAILGAIEDECERHGLTVEFD